MTEDRPRFDTGVAGIWGRWPAKPHCWSYTALTEFETCPNRWVLSRADYPDIWDKRGYPPLPVTAAIFGSVVHGCIERLAHELAAARIDNPGTSEVVGVLSSLGGWRTIVLDAIEQQLSEFDGNPRVSAERVERVRQDLIRRSADAADQVKVLLGRRGFSGAPRRSADSMQAGCSPGLKPRAVVRAGAHAEQEVIADRLRMTGHIDQLTIAETGVTITEFKTGHVRPDHDDQVRIYALLWHLDEQVNPTGTRATQLVVAYPTSEHSVTAPDHEQLAALELSTASRIDVADSAITQHEAPATPGQDTCRYCDVKHLCDGYWATIPPTIADVSTDQWFDFEGRILRRNGAKSWFAEPVAGPPREVLVRTVETDPPFEIGRRVRLLGVRRSRDPDDDDRLVISMVATSECYLLAS